MSAIPGYDGHSATTELIRDPDGEGKRELTVQVRYDMIGKLHQQGIIKSYQWAAASKLQMQAEAAALMSRPSYEGPRGQNSRFAISDTQENAMHRHYDTNAAVNHAMGKAGTRGEKLLDLIVLKNHNLKASAKIMGIAERNIAECLRFALDVLARHYNLA